MRPINKKDFDTSVRPQDDFYRYVNGGWLKRNTIPKSENRWGSFHILHDKNRKILYSLLKDLGRKASLKKRSDEEKIHSLFLSSMDMKKRNRQGLDYLKETFKRIDAVEKVEDLTELFAHLHMHGVGAPWSLWIDQDSKNSKRMSLHIGQAGIGVPNKGYHIKKDAESKRVQNAYKKYIEKILQLEKKYSKKERGHAIKKILDIELKLAQSSLDPVELRDVHKTYNKYTSSGLKKLCPSILWDKYLDLMKIPQIARPHIIVDNPNFLKKVENLLQKLPIEDWKTYLHWHFLNSYSGFLSEPFIKESFLYHGKAIQGTKEMPELWKRSIGISNSLMGDALGKIYVKKYFPPSSKRTITKLVKNLTEAYKERIEKLDWMTPETKRHALDKLKAISLQLGYPNKWESYKKLNITRESFVKNVIEGFKFEFEKEVKKLSKPTDPTEWFIPASTVNAFYSPNLNQITFPAGILQPPFFYPDADDAINYGAIGAIIGHELTHGFDDNGSLYDKDGNLKNWWKKIDRKKFDTQAKKLIKQFNDYKVVDGIKVNGKLTLGENIADLGGLVIAYEAFEMATKGRVQKKIDGFTPDQRFFISHALSERALFRDNFLKYLVLNDTHSPNEFRSNGPVSNHKEFYRVFDVKSGDALFRKEKDRASIW